MPTKKAKFLFIPNFSRFLQAAPGLTLLLLIALSQTPSLAYAQANLLKDPSFDGPYKSLEFNKFCPNISGEIADGWDDNTCWTGSGAHVAYAQDTSVLHSGLSSQRVTLTTGQWQLAQWLPFASAKVYHASIWLRGATSMQVTLTLRQADEPYTAYSSRTFHVTTKWKRYTLSGRAETMDGVLLVSGTDPGTLWMDDADLKTSRAPNDPLPTTAVKRSFFGAHYHSPDTLFPRVGHAVGAIRLWDAEGCQWAEVNSAEGIYDWSILDKRVRIARRHNVRILMNLGRTPRWASARPDEPSSYGPGQAAEPADDRYWREWVAAIGTRYRGKIKYWEIWNEPNEKSFYSGSVPKLVSLARQAYNILKQIDPANQIVTPSAVGNIGWLGDYFAHGGGKHADIVGYHFYLSPGHDEPELLYDAIIPNVQAVMKRYHQQDKPLWDTEAGWLAPDKDGNPLLPDETAVGYIGRRHLLEWARGISQMNFYAWDNHDAISIEPTFSDNTTLTPAGTAYRTIAKWLTGSTLKNLKTDARGTWIIKLKRPSGNRSYIVWNPRHSAADALNFTIPAAWNIRMRRDLDGLNTRVLDSTLIDGRPILLEPGQQRTSISGGVPGIE